MDSEYYFIQFWAFENPVVLTYGEGLLGVLRKRWLEEWDKIPDRVDDKIMLVSKRYEYNLVGKKYFEQRRKKTKEKIAVKESPLKKNEEEQDGLEAITKQDYQGTTSVRI